MGRNGLTTKEWVERAQRVHGKDHYDYSMVEYKKKGDPLIIRCIQHNYIFEQVASNHIGGAGCIYCGRERVSEKNKLAQSKTLEQFILDAVAVHGNKYGYSKVKYTNGRTNVSIQCPIHGEFEQYPEVHLKGSGCTKCGKEKSRLASLKTLEQFIESAIKVHGDKYNYSKVKYKTCKDEVVIICPIHGEFSQIPDSHINGKHGCNKCANELIGLKRRVPFDIFVKQANEIHQGFYSYESAMREYRGTHSEVHITCPEHGPFKQRGEIHLRGHGCSKCANRYRRNTEEIIQEFKRVHGNRYNYSKVDFKSMHTPIEVRCVEHDSPFYPSPASHLYSVTGCPICGGTLKKTNEQFIQEATEKHNGFYDYSLVEYTNIDSTVSITCPIHGPFTQKAYDHLRGCGCPSCQQSKGENEVSKVLDKVGVKYLTQKTFPKCKLKRVLKFDFYLPEYDLCIEYQGEGHYFPVRFNGISLEKAEGNFKLQQLRDSIKRKFCQNHNLSLLEIDYWDFGNIEYILNKTIRRE